MGVINLPYLSREGTEIKTPYGFYEVLEADYYRKVVTRNRVVLRIDLLSGLGEFFSENSLEKYRELIYTVMSGKTIDANIVSNVLTAFYKEDKTFRKLLGEIVYFNEAIYEESVYVILMKKLVNTFNESKEFVMKKVQDSGYKVLFESCGHLYISIPDVHKTVYLPKGYKEEVLSYAKIWPGDITRN